MNKIYPCINILIPFFRRQGTLHSHANFYFHDAKTNSSETFAMPITSHIIFFITLIRCFCNYFPASFGAGNYKTAYGRAIFPVSANYRRWIELQMIFSRIFPGLSTRIALKSQSPHCFRFGERGAGLSSYI